MLCGKDSMKIFHIYNNLHNRTVKKITIIFLLITIILITCLHVNSYTSAYSISDDNIHNSLASSYKISFNKTYTDSVPSGSSNFYYIDLGNNTFDETTCFSLKISGNNLNCLDFQVFTDSFTSISFSMSSSPKKSCTIHFSNKYNTDRFYLAFNNNHKSKKNIYSFKLNVLTPATPSPKPKSTPKTSVKSKKNTKTTQRPKRTKKTQPTYKPQKTKQPVTTKKPASTKKPAKNNTSKYKIRKIKLSKNFIRLSVDSGYFFTYKITPADAKNKKLKWHSSNPKIVSVNSGHIIAHKKGIAIIHVSALSNKKVTASCTVKVI